MIDNVEFQKDLGIRFEIQLKFHSHTTEVACLLGVIRRSSDHLDLDMYVDYIIICYLGAYTTIQCGDHHLHLIKGRLKRFSVELQDCYYQLETNLMGKTLNTAVYCCYSTIFNL